MNGIPPAPPPPPLEPPPPEQSRPPSHVLEIVLVSLAFAAGGVIAIVGVATTPPLAGARQTAASQSAATPSVQTDEGAAAGEESDGGQTDPIQLINGRAKTERFACDQVHLTFAWEFHPSEPPLPEPTTATFRVTGPVLLRTFEGLAFFDVSHNTTLVVNEGSHKWTADVTKIGNRPVIAPKVTARFKTTC